MPEYLRCLHSGTTNPYVSPGCLVVFNFAGGPGCFANLGRQSRYESIPDYPYDANSQLLERRYPNGARATFAYDAGGNRILKENADIAVSLVYDGLGRSQSVSSDMASAPKTIHYRYNAAEQRLGMTDPDGGRFTYAYDPLGQIAWLENPQGQRTSYVYDANGRRTLKALANGTMASLSYDNAGQVKILDNLKSDDSVLSRYTYTYDAAGNRTSVQQVDGSRVTWSYDNANQLAREQHSGTPQTWSSLTVDDWDQLSVDAGGPGCFATFGPTESARGFVDHPGQMVVDDPTIVRHAAISPILNSPGHFSRLRRPRKRKRGCTSQLGLFQSTVPRGMPTSHFKTAMTSWAPSISAF